MSTIHDIDERQIHQMQLSAYDRTSAVLWSLTMIFAVLGAFSLLMWLQLAKYKSDSAQDNTFTAIPIPTGFGDPGDPRPKGVGDDAEDPGIEEFYEVDVPQLADAVEAVTDAPSRLRGMLAAVDGTEELMGHGRGLGARGGGGGGGGGDPERWAIEYESENIGKYVDQLTAFGVEIGFVSKVTDRVEVLFNLKSSPQIRPTTKALERRNYFIPAPGKLKAWDQQMAANAGIKPEGKIMVQFYPEQTIATLLALEAAEAASRGISDLRSIQRTTFKVREAGGGFEYYVADMVQK